MKHYLKPTLELTKITTNEAMAAGSPVFTQIGTQDVDGTTVTVYEITSFDGGSNQ